MNISTLFLSISGFCVFYICNADWIDDLIDDYLGTDYEEVPPFIASVTAGTEEFDHMVEELTRSRYGWFSISSTLFALISVLIVTFLMCQQGSVVHGKRLVIAGAKLLADCWGYPYLKQNQNLVVKFFDEKLKSLCKWKDGDDDVPVKLLWQGNSLVESSVHCNIRNEVKAQDMHRHLMQTRMLYKSPGAGGDKRVELTSSISEDSTAQKMADIRKLLESEQEIVQKFVDKGSGTDDGREVENRRKMVKTNSSLGCRISERQREKKDSQTMKKDEETEETNEQKLMNRIRLLESRLRLEELKNKNWIDRMTRAEGILQQLNKQVEQIEESRPVETLTETLKITSTVTNWAPGSAHPRRNMHFTMIKQSSPFFLQAPYKSLSEVIQKEVGLPSPIESNRYLYQLPPTPQIPTLPSTAVRLQSSILSKFFYR